ncbi:unnamed protein product [Mytilus coruscus]|uniref:C-type lectin domain-containing protein n=1 Tax=Mytilus coruscus TaxID=42192 RepID=A0A6J8BU51_MYTCO|nr:unnamed protein product [Mytilus coruscus]
MTSGLSKQKQKTSSCLSHHADLVKVETVDEETFLKTNARAFGTHFWLGARDDITEGSWVWSEDDSDLDYTDWYPAEPNNSGGDEDCLELSGSHNWQWNDAPYETLLREISSNINIVAPAIFGHNLKECENDWKCKGCGKSGHKQDACTEDMFTEDKQHTDNTESSESKEEKEDETSKTQTGDEEGIETDSQSTETKENQNDEDIRRPHKS